MKSDDFPFSGIRLTRPPLRLGCVPRWSCDFTLKDFDLWFILQGSGWLSIDGIRQEIAAPRAVLFRPGQHILGGHDPKDPFEVFFFHFLLQSTPARSDWQPPQRLSPKTATQCTVLIELCLQAGDNGRSLEAAGSVASAMLATLWIAQEYNPGSVTERLETLIRRIAENPELPWYLTDMARESGCSVSYFTREFRRLANSSPASFVIEARIRKARTLLKETPLPLKEIAEAAGYKDVYFFSRQFRMHQGISPGAYRANPQNPPFPSKSRKPPPR